jgi:uncharacterized protein
MEQALWIHGLAGGALIGTAAVALYALSGRLAGVSGIASSLILNREGRDWRLAFIVGLILGGWLALAAGAAVPGPPLGGSVLLLLAGLLVGFGTRIGAGCTSGHGICGLARLSPRSLAAVITFMAVGAFTATLLRPWLV